jgi:DNA-binding beta-propeller fold protein YncE
LAFHRKPEPGRRGRFMLNRHQLMTSGLTAVFLAVACSRGVAKDTGLLFVSNERTNNLIIIDPKTKQIVKDLKVSRRPRDMHFSADHSKLYVA